MFLLTYKGNDKQLWWNKTVKSWLPQRKAGTKFNSVQDIKLHLGSLLKKHPEYFFEKNSSEMFAIDDTTQVLTSLSEVNSSMYQPNVNQNQPLVIALKQEHAMQWYNSKLNRFQMDGKDTGISYFKKIPHAILKVKNLTVMEDVDQDEICIFDTVKNKVVWNYNSKDVWHDDLIEVKDNEPKTTMATALINAQLTNLEGSLHNLNKNNQQLPIDKKEYSLEKTREMIEYLLSAIKYRLPELMSEMKNYDEALQLDLLHAIEFEDIDNPQKFIQDFKNIRKERRRVKDEKGLLLAINESFNLIKCQKLIAQFNVVGERHYTYRTEEIKNIISGDE